MESYESLKITRYPVESTKAINVKLVGSSTDESIYPNIESNNVDRRFKKVCGCPTILIVDDQFINRFIIKQFCSKYGIASDEAEDGEQAVAKATAAASRHCCDGFELALMDLNMPVLGGVEASRQIMDLKLSRRVNQSLKIVAVTAFPSKTEKQK
mmetsp:Transcript_1045/g.1011  ORF Transcript_1045/g.1011 Transcript_1045/m.1011 type:complete len:155 (+) Transcript_1045:913-1377(+)